MKGKRIPANLIALAFLTVSVALGPSGTGEGLS